MVTVMPLKRFRPAPLLLSLLMAMSGLVAINPVVSSTKSGLEVYQWSNRLIVVFSHAHAMDTFVSQLEQFSSQIDERHIVWMVISSDSLRSNDPGLQNRAFDANKLIESYLSDGGYPQVLLIGKDGTLKNKSRELELDDIFSQIDQMPMRRREMKMMNQGLLAQ